MQYVQWTAYQLIERRATGILKHQRYTAVIVRKRDRSRRPLGINFGLERIFVLKSLDATERGFFSSNKQDWRQAVTRAPVSSDAALPQRREYVAREPVHEGSWWKYFKEACSVITRVTACTLAQSPIRDTLTRGFSDFVASMTVPVAFGWSVCRAGL